MRVSVGRHVNYTHIYTCVYIHVFIYTCIYTIYIEINGLFCDLEIAVSINFGMCFNKTNLTCLHINTPVI